MPESDNTPNYAESDKTENSVVIKWLRFCSAEIVLCIYTTSMLIYKFTADLGKSTLTLGEIILWYVVFLTTIVAMYGVCKYRTLADAPSDDKETLTFNSFITKQVAELYIKTSASIEQIIYMGVLALSASVLVATEAFGDRTEHTFNKVAANCIVICAVCRLLFAHESFFDLTAEIQSSDVVSIVRVVTVHGTAILSIVALIVDMFPMNTDYETAIDMTNLQLLDCKDQSISDSNILYFTLVLGPLFLFMVCTVGSNFVRNFTPDWANLVNWQLHWFYDMFFRLAAHIFVFVALCELMRYMAEYNDDIKTCNNYAISRIQMDAWDRSKKHDYCCAHSLNLFSFRQSDSADRLGNCLVVMQMLLPQIFLIIRVLQIYQQHAVQTS